MKPSKKSHTMNKLLLAIALIFPLASSAQQKQYHKCSDRMTKYETLASQATSTMMKIVDTERNRLLVSSDALETSIRTVNFGMEYYYFRLEQKATSSEHGDMAMIEYGDVVDINNAIETMLHDYKFDKAARQDYIENKYITEDGFEVGYVISKNDSYWFVKLNWHSNNIITMNTKDNLVKVFKNAQIKMEALQTER